VDEARKEADAARALGIDNAQATAMLNEVAIQQKVGDAINGKRWIEAQRLVDQLAGVDARNEAIARFRSDITQGLERERTAELGQRIVAIQEKLRGAVQGRRWKDAQGLVDQLARLDPSNPALVSMRTAITQGLDQDAAKLTQGQLAAAERNGIVAFYSGEYAQAISLLQTLPSNSPRASFYLACSNAALSLVEGQKDPTRLQTARQQYSRARASENRFEPDRKYISPRILRLLDASP
jgi:hypothetical protein